MQAKYINVVHQDTAIVCNDELTNKQVVIDKSISILFFKDDYDNTTIYNSVGYHEQKYMETLEKFIRGTMTFSKANVKLLSNMYVRFGWLDKTLGQLRWVPIVDIVDAFVRRDLTPTEKGKFQEICKMLSLSMKDARRYHNVEGKLYQPKKKITNIVYGMQTQTEEV